MDCGSVSSLRVVGLPFAYTKILCFVLTEGCRVLVGLMVDCTVKAITSVLLAAPVYVTLRIMFATIQRLLRHIETRLPYPPVIQGLVALILFATPLSAFSVTGEATFSTGYVHRFWALVGLVGLHLLALSFIPVRRLSWWQQLLFLVFQCGVSVLARVVFPAPMLDYVYLAIVLQAIYLFRAWLWAPFAVGVWMVWSGTFMIASASLVDWLQSNLVIAFPATCMLIAAIVYARQQQRHDQVRQVLQQMQQRYDNLALALRDVQQRAMLEERQRLAQLINGEMSTALARTEQSIAAAINQAQTNFARLGATVAQTRDASSAALERLRAAITTLRRADLDSPNAMSPAASVALLPKLDFGMRFADQLLLPSLPQKLLTWILPLVFVSLAFPLTLLESSPEVLWKVLLFCGLLLVMYVLTQRMRHPLWLQAGLIGQVVTVLALVMLTQVLPMLLGLLLVMWQIALRLSSIQIITFLVGVQASTGIAATRMLSTPIEYNSNVLIFGVACAAVATLLWMARRQLSGRYLDELRLARLAELMDELAQQEFELRKLAVATERTRMARECHDDLGHRLVLISVQLQLVEELIDEDPNTAVTQLVATRDQLHAAWQSVLSVADATLPLDTQSLEQALQHLVHQCQSSTQSHIEICIVGSLKRLPSAVACTVYRTVQEGLTNACKYAHAPHIQVTVRRDSAQIRVSVCDDGQGLAPASVQMTMPAGAGLQPYRRQSQPTVIAADHPLSGVQGSFGLVGLQERAEVLGGRVESGPLPEGGFHLDLTLPLAEERE